VKHPLRILLSSVVLLLALFPSPGIAGSAKVRQGDRQVAGMYLTGRGAPQSDNTAAVGYRRAAEAGSPDAQVMLGWMHEVGRGVPKDLDEAARWFGLAATQGNEVARVHLKHIETLR